MANHKVIPEERRCLLCPNVFLVGGFGNKKRSQLYCSWECRSKTQRQPRTKPVRAMTETECAYLAGIIDGEGHISIYGAYGKKDTHGYRAAMGVANTSVPMLEWIQQTTGVGGISSQGRPEHLQKPVYQWNISSENVYDVLKQILPYLVVKPDRARLVMEFYDRIRDPLQKADRSWQTDYVDRIRAMNKRGPVNEPELTGTVLSQQATLNVDPVVGLQPVNL